MHVCVCICIYVHVCTYHHNSLCIEESRRGYSCQFAPGGTKGLKTDIVRHHMTLRLPFLIRMSYDYA